MINPLLNTECFAFYWQQMNSFVVNVMMKKLILLQKAQNKINCICIATIANGALGFKVEAESNGDFSHHLLGNKVF